MKIPKLGLESLPALSLHEPARMNIYACEECGEEIVSREIRAGVTPFLFFCFACGAPARSNMYRDQGLDPDDAVIEWFQPATQEEWEEHCQRLVEMADKRRGFLRLLKEEAEELGVTMEVARERRLQLVFLGVREHVAAGGLIWRQVRELPVPHHFKVRMMGRGNRGPSHVEVAVFAGKRGQTLANIGTLRMDEEDWSNRHRLFAKGVEVEELEPVAVEP